MNYLINVSNQKAGGGIQVALSICGQLKRFPKIHFVVVLNTIIDDSFIDYGNNVEVYKYDIKNNVQTLLLGRDPFLDSLVKEYKIDAVLTVFGPSRWQPRVPHLCGFARAQLLPDVSAVNKGKSFGERIKCSIWKWYFKRSSRFFYTENDYISKQLLSVFSSIKVYTVTNYYNQVFDQPEKWKYSYRLLDFDGITCLSVSSYYPHKNFEILIDVVKILREKHPDTKFRFVLTFKENQMHVPEDVADAFVFLGSVNITECPNLYNQCDIMFMPTLMECFTATYPEAMRMKKPIVTTNLEFARGLCGDAACYYKALDANDAAEVLYKVATDVRYSQELIENGNSQLLKFDNYEQRADKLIGIMGEIAKDYHKKSF